MELIIICALKMDMFPFQCGIVKSTQKVQGVNYLGGHAPSALLWEEAWTWSQEGYRN